jgi:hypothetical protein
VAPFGYVVGAMAEAPRLLGGRCGIVSYEEVRPVIQIMNNVPALCDDEVIMWGGNVLSDSRGNDERYVALGPTSLNQALREALEQPARRDACRDVLQAAARTYCNDEIGKTMMEEINRRLGDLSISVCREVGWLEGLERSLDGLYSLLFIFRVSLDMGITEAGSRCGPEGWEVSGGADVAS